MSSYDDRQDSEYYDSWKESGSDLSFEEYEHYHEVEDYGMTDEELGDYEDDTKDWY